MNAVTEDQFHEPGSKPRLAERVKTACASTSARAQELRENVSERTRNVAWATDDFVHDHPYRTLGAAFGVGLVLGLLVSRR